MNLFPLFTIAFALTNLHLRADEVVAGCVWIRAENDGSGAGFLVDAKKKWVVTCRHVVGERNRLDVYFAWKRGGSLATEKAEYLANRDLLRERKLLVTGTVLRKSDVADLALIELDALPESVAALSLASAEVRLGDPLRAVGHRLDLETLFNITTGPVRQVGLLANGYTWRGKKLAANVHAIIGQLPIEEGDSGGPVLNPRGEVVGMSSALRRETPSAAVAISAKEIRKFLLGGTGFQPVQEPVPRLKAGATQKLAIVDTLVRSTVWIRPTATDVHLAGVLIEKNLILTSARGLGNADRVGIAFPLRENDKWVGEREPYRDPVGLHLEGVWRAGTVLARDPARDLALIRVDSSPDTSRPVSLATRLPAPGDSIHTMSHPGGLEFAWVYASGSVRQRGRIALEEGEKSARVAVNVLQVPAQSASPGGPVLNERGELIGVLSARESAQQTGYAATGEEIARFLDVALSDRPPKTVEGLLARAEAIPTRLVSALAEAFALRAEDSLNRRAAAAHADCLRSLALDPTCFRAYRCLAEIHLLQEPGLELVRASLDKALESGHFDRDALRLRARCGIEMKQWRSARGDLERILEVLPADSVVRQQLIRVFLELSKDDEAAAAVGDVLRVEPARLPQLAADLLKQVEAMEQKFPATPSLPANWLKRAIGAAQKSTSDPKRKAEYEVVLKAAEGAKSDIDRLAILREFLTKLTSKTGE